MEWSKEKTIEFITCYKAYSLLWDSQHEYYKDRVKRYEALNTLAKRFETQVPEVERKIKNLQSHFLRERKRIKKNPPTWFAYKPLSFLLTRKKTELRRQSSVILDTDTHKATHTPVTATRVETMKNTPTGTNSRVENLNNYQEHTPESFSVVKEMFKWFKERDEFDLYGEQVAIKLRKISSPFARVTVQNRMNALLMEAELGMFDNAHHYQEPSSVEFYTETKIDVSESVTPDSDLQ